MIKIFMSVRNRLGITKKCIEALKKHSKLPHQIYVYDNETNYRLREHFDYFADLYERKEIAQITFTTYDSTFNAFSKASTSNFFGLQHEQDPLKDTYTFLLMMDNDIIVTPEWDIILHGAWKFIKKNKMNNIKVIGQLPGGIKPKSKEGYPVGKLVGRVGKLGGSGLWSVRPNFFRDVGFLDLKQLVGHDKKHDQSYWRLLNQKTNNQPYIMGLNHKLGIHCGRDAGSICNRLTRNKGNKKKEEMIKFPEADKKIESQDFDTFFNHIKQNIALHRDW